MKSKILAKKAIVCDLDGTLALSKAPIDREMAELISSLLKRYKFAVLGGGKPDLFFSQVSTPLKKLGKETERMFKKLALLPTSGACGYVYSQKEWKELYAEKLSPKEVSLIRASFAKVYKDIGYKQPNKIYGEIIEDRGTAVVFSALGHDAPLEKRSAWNKSKDQRKKISKALSPLLPNHEIKIGGLTSIDVTRKGVDKAFGIEKIKEIFSLKTEEIVFLGDALFPGGNDEPVKRSGVETMQVHSPEDTKKIFKQWLAM